MRIYLADLGHNQLTMSSDIYPLGVANLATYLQAYGKVGSPLDIRLFREPEDLRKALDEAAPDVLGLSSYSWNHELSRNFAEYAKSIDSSTLTLLGGPNFPLTSNEQEIFLRGLPMIDGAVRGPTYEAEKAFLNVIERYAEAGKSIEGLQEAAVPGNMWINRHTGEFVQGGEVPRILDLDEIPSPYLQGLMDPYFDTGYFPMMQIARGCPFSCAFCNSSVKSNSKIYRHSVANVIADLDYIAERVKPEMTLCFADDNFGMYKDDEEIADYFSHLQKRYNWPQYIRTTTGKNNHERIIRVIRKTGGILPMTSAVQSMNPLVLKNINRSNIKLEAYAEIQKEVQAQGMQAYGELILCLPGETKESFMKSVDDLIGSGVSRISAHQLMLLHGAPLSNPDSREKYEFKTRFRVVARNIGSYPDEPVVETEEMVVETSTFSFDDYLDCRVFHLLLTIYYYEGNFEEAFEFARQCGVSPFEVIVKMQSMLDQAPESVTELISQFLKESQEELFDTKAECISWARDNFAALIDGSLGGNLLSKYSMSGRFYCTKEAVEFLKSGMHAAIGDLDKPTEEAMETVMKYLQNVLLYAPFSQSLEESPRWDMTYDVEAWRDGNYAKELKSHRLAVPQTYMASVKPEIKSLIESRIATFGEHPSQLGKFTRTMFARDLHRSLVVIEHADELEHVSAD